MGLAHRCRPAISRSLKATHIILGPRSEDQGYRRNNASCQSSAPQDQVDECPADSPISVDERVDRLKLGMRSRCLGYRGQRVAIPLLADTARERGIFFSVIIEH